MNEQQKKIALALDFSTERALSAVLGRLSPQPHILKIGLELVAALGIRESIALTRSLAPEAEIFLDLKLHDIPNTVAHSVQNFAKLGVNYLTIHSLGGRAMMQAAQEAASDRLKLIAVSILTSHSLQGLQEMFAVSDIEQQVFCLADLALQSGIEHMVCSPHELARLKREFPQLQAVTPGIRMPAHDIQDQARVMSPRQALELGAAMLVIGRPVSQSPDPANAWIEILDSVKG